MSASMAQMKRKARKQGQRELRKRQMAQGLDKPAKQTIPNRKSTWKTPEEERGVRQKAIEDSLSGWRNLLPGLLKDLDTIDDPRNPGKIKHKLTVLLLYGLLAFVFHYTSRREACREMSCPVFYENLKLIFPELETLPHHDTLKRLLERIKVEEIETAHIQMLKRLIRQKKFRNYLVKKRYLIAIDGTQKFTSEACQADEQLHRHTNGKSEEPQYYVYLLEAKLIFPNGLVLPLMSEFLDNTIDEVSSKQDCELKAFNRLAQRLNTAFPRLPITLLLDGLYANGPVIAQCRKYRWQFMIVLQDDSLPTVWKEAKGLMKLHPEQVYHRTWKGRKQTFHWTNHIQYEYGKGGKLKQTVHVIVCEEVWEEVDSKGEILTKRSRHAWLSSEPIQKKNVHERCNLMARSRWGLENDILQEKKQGYQYEHVFAYEWHAMKGYHYLMHLAHLINELVQLSIELEDLMKVYGLRGFVQFIRETIGNPWLDPSRIEKRLTTRQQWRWIM